MRRTSNTAGYGANAGETILRKIIVSFPASLTSIRSKGGDAYVSLRFFWLRNLVDMSGPHDRDDLRLYLFDEEDARHGQPDELLHEKRGRPS